MYDAILDAICTTLSLFLSPFLASVMQLDNLRYFPAAGKFTPQQSWQTKFPPSGFDAVEAKSDVGAKDAPG